MADAPTIGLICAIPQERVDLRAALEHDRRLEIGGFGFDRGLLDGRAVVLAEAGIGKVNTAAVATLLADRFAAHALVFSGVAGGLDPDLAIGDVVIAGRAIQHDAGVIENERLHPYQAGHVPFFNPTPELGYRVDPALLDRVRDQLRDLELAPLSAAAGGSGRRPKLVYGTILAGDQFIHCENTRERLHREFQAHAVAMEGAALAQVAERLGVPWLEVRALSDLAGQDSRFDFAKFVEEVARSSALILRRLLPVL
ncbi:MAG TPA: 5'-methylthioadenosine/adenosylhomocysteine nucleosidase [Geminicoccaceae bacterium]|nr:5'-methylthioadenosine/adenosylhomocysteine nucleosidase [Geminicoccaceae bacterium]